MESPSASVKTEISVKPERSQAVLVALLVLAGLTAICGTALLAVDKPAGWGAYGITVLCLLTGALGWWRSQPATDMSDGPPATLQTPAGSLTADIRLFQSPDALQGMMQVVNVLCHVKPLPAPDGHIDANGQVIVLTEAEAAQRIDIINNQTKREIADAINQVGLAFERGDAQEVQPAGELMRAPKGLIAQGLNAGSG